MFNFLCYASALSEATVTVQTFFLTISENNGYPKVATPCLLYPKVTGAVTFGIVRYIVLHSLERCSSSLYLVLFEWNLK